MTIDPGSGTFGLTLAAIERASPEVAGRIRAAAATNPATSLATSPAGEPVVVDSGVPLDSLRDPRGAADRLAARVSEGPVVIAGLGTGYLAEAIAARGLRIAAIVDRPGAFAAAINARDLRHVLRGVRLILIDRDDQVSSAVREARALASTLVKHAAAVSRTPILERFVGAWNRPATPVRPPRVLMVGPIYGGSLGLARAAWRACRVLVPDAELFDASPFADGWHLLGGLPIPNGARVALQGGLATTIGEAIVARATTMRADLVVAIAQAPLGATAIEALRKAGCTTAFWFVENHRVLPYWRSVAPHYDWFFAIQPGRFLEMLADAGARHPEYLPVACDPTRHQPVTLSPEEHARYGAAVSFAGAPYLNRRRVFARLADFPLRLWGPGWSDPLLAPLVVEDRAFTEDEMLRIFAATRVNLNLHSASHVDGLDPDPDYVNPRTFELAACGAFQLTDRRSPLPALFAEDEIATFGSVSELRARIEYFLAKDDEREAYAARARRRALAEHTYVHRLRRLLELVLPPPLSAGLTTQATAAGTAGSLQTRIDALRERDAAMGREETMLRLVQSIGAEAVRP